MNFSNKDLTRSSSLRIQIQQKNLNFESKVDLYS